jgi:hypothetical protein
MEMDVATERLEAPFGRVHPLEIPELELGQAPKEWDLPARAEEPYGRARPRVLPGLGEASKEWTLPVLFGPDHPFDEVEAGDRPMVHFENVLPVQDYRLLGGPHLGDAPSDLGLSPPSRQENADQDASTMEVEDQTHGQPLPGTPRDIQPHATVTVPSIEPVDAMVSSELQGRLQVPTDFGLSPSRRDYADRATSMEVEDQPQVILTVQSIEPEAVVSSELQGRLQAPTTGSLEEIDLDLITEHSFVSGIETISRLSTLTASGSGALAGFWLQSISETSTPGPAKSVLHSYYGKLPSRTQLSKDDFLTWNDGGSAHLLKHTSIFLCPITKEPFPAGSVGTGYTIQNRHGYTDVEDPETSARVIWYSQKVLAEHAAAARACDCLRYRYLPPNETFTRYCNEEPHDVGTAVPLPTPSAKIQRLLEESGYVTSNTAY